MKENPEHTPETPEYNEIPDLDEKLREHIAEGNLSKEMGLCLRNLAEQNPEWFEEIRDELDWLMDEIEKES